MTGLGIARTTFLSFLYSDSKLFPCIAYCESVMARKVIIYLDIWDFFSLSKSETACSINTVGFFQPTALPGQISIKNSSSLFSHIPQPSPIAKESRIQKPAFLYLCWPLCFPEGRRETWASQWRRQTKHPERRALKRACSLALLLLWASCNIPEMPYSQLEFDIFWNFIFLFSQQQVLRSFVSICLWISLLKGGL